MQVLPRLQGRKMPSSVCLVISSKLPARFTRTDLSGIANGRPPIHARIILMEFLRCKRSLEQLLVKPSTQTPNQSVGDSNSGALPNRIIRGCATCNMSRNCGHSLKGYFIVFHLTLIHLTVSCLNNS